MPKPGLALILDMDGVVVDSNPLHREAWRIYNRRFGIETDDASELRMYGRRNDEIVRDFFGADLSEQEILTHGAEKEKLYREMLGACIDRALVPGIRQFLDRHRLCPIALATNAERANVEFLLARAGLQEYFSVVVDGFQVRQPKPHPDIFLCAAERLGVNPRNCIVFEDSFAGVEAARAAGMRTVGVRTTHHALPGVDFSVDHFLCTELEAWLHRQQPLP